MKMDCRFFTGTKPCGFNLQCDAHCTTYQPVRMRILLIHLGALGAVVRSTSLLKSIHEKYPQSHLTWVTEASAQPLLLGHPRIDQVLTLRMEDLLTLSAQTFDIAFVIDKSLKAAGVLKWTEARKVFGFVTDPLTGAIVPANSEAEELWQIGLSNQKKFFENKKPETQLIAEALQLPYCRNPYDLPLSVAEKFEVRKMRQEWGSTGAVIVGINTGCSPEISAKKLTVEKHRELIREILKIEDTKVILLGGPEDTKRNQEISQGLKVINTPTEKGLRAGLCAVSACDIVFSGDSLGMHMALSQNIWTIAWFGPTCAHEIDFFDHGIAIKSELSCSPCWKRTCSQSVMCYDDLSIEKVMESIKLKIIEMRKSKTKSVLSSTITECEM